MRVEIRRSTEEFRELESQWIKLQSLCNDISIFQTWKWIWTWWQTLGTQKAKMVKGTRNNGLAIYAFKHKATPFLVCIWDKDSLVGIAPMMERHFKKHELTFIGDDDQEYHNFLIKNSSKEIEKLCCMAINDELNKSSIEILDLKGISSDSFIYNYFYNLSPEYNKAKFFYSRSPVLQLEMTKTINPKGRVKSVLNRGERKLVNNYTDFKVSIINNKNDIISYRKSIQDLVMSYWQKRKAYSIFHVVGHDSFITRLLDQLPEDRVKIFVAEVSRELIGFAICFIYNSTCYYWIPGRKEDGWEVYPIGHIIIKNIIDYCQSNNIYKLDFLRGSHDYKLDWGAIPNERIRLVVSLDSNLLDICGALSYPFGEDVPGMEELNDHDCREIEYI